MPNPYDDIFGNKNEESQPPGQPARPFNLPDDDYPEYDKEPLDEIIELINNFQKKAERFSELLTHTRAVDNKVEKKLMGKFIVMDDPHDKGNLEKERVYYNELENDFKLIIKPMKVLAMLHLEAVKKYDLHIDDNYYSIEKEAAQLKSEIEYAKDGINLQRKILADATDDLIILKDAMAQTEKRLKNYIDAGGKNNISASEVALIIRKRKELTSGINHKFDYTFFKINLLDKAAMSLGFFMKETFSQYLQKLEKAILG